MEHDLMTVGIVLTGLSVLGIGIWLGWVAGTHRAHERFELRATRMVSRHNREVAGLMERHAHQLREAIGTLRLEALNTAEMMDRARHPTDLLTTASRLRPISPAPTHRRTLDDQTTTIGGLRFRPLADTTTGGPRG